MSLLRDLNLLPDRIIYQDNVFIKIDDMSSSYYRSLHGKRFIVSDIISIDASNDASSKAFLGLWTKDIFWSKLESGEIQIFF